MTAIMPEQHTETTDTTIGDRPAGMSDETWAIALDSRDASVESLRPAEYDRGGLELDILAALHKHGLIDLESVTVDVRDIEQGGMFAGVTFSGMVYQRPASLPPAAECARPAEDHLAATAEMVEAQA